MIHTGWWSGEQNALRNLLEEIEWGWEIVTAETLMTALAAVFVHM